MAGVGVNSIVPARGGDVIKIYLVKHRMEAATYPTLASTLVVETIFDFFVAGGLMIWALSIGVLPTHQVYSRIPTVDWKFLLRHERAIADRARPARRPRRDRRSSGRASTWRSSGAACGSASRSSATGGGSRSACSCRRRSRGASGSRRSTSSCEAFGVHASIHNALLAQVVDSLATLFPATPGGAGTKQGLIVFLFRGQAISKALLLAFSVGMNIAITVTNLVLGLISIGLMAKTLSFKNLRQRSRAEQEQPV